MKNYLLVGILYIYNYSFTKLRNKQNNQPTNQPTNQLHIEESFFGS
jgi:hypothetical protein